MTDPAPATALEALALAKQHHQAGRLAQARQSYRQALSLDDRNVESLFFLATIDVQEGHTQAAAELLRKAIEVQPALLEAYRVLAGIQWARGDAEAAIASFRQGLDASPGNLDLQIGLANMLVRAARLDEAIALYRKALAQAPQRPDLHNNLGVALDRHGLVEQAIDSFGQALALHGNYAEAHANRANVLVKAGRQAEAIEGYRRALGLKPDFLAAWIDLAKLLVALGRSGEAIEAWRRAVALKPDLVEGWTDLATLLMAQGRAASAIEAWRKAVALKPDDATMLANLANALASLERYPEALELYRRVVALRPDFAEMIANIGFCLNELGRPQEAITAFRRALELNSRLEGAYNGLGIASMFLGDGAEARRAFTKAIALSPSSAHFHYNLSDFVKFTPESPELAALLELEKQNSAPVQYRAHLHFALAKAYNDMSQYADAWRHLETANRLHRRSLSYDHAASLASFDRVRRQFTRDFIRRHENFGNPSPLPVFIIGMARSGTSLVEQLLSGHPDVFGAGELLDFGAALTEIEAERGERRAYPDSAPSLSPSYIAAIGDRYLDKIRPLLPTARRITDKLPQNFLLAGFIHLALPNAPIIHIFRDAGDTCLSNFFKLFSAGHEHSYDLVELGQYYRAYQRLMDYWREVLPPGRILDVRYEDLVADLEGQTRRIVAHCGLEWDARCLEFYKVRRAVVTASAAQVRRPIYDTSIGRWRNYERFLGPLLSELNAA